MSFLKHIVSKKKRRFKADGFDLDLSYIGKHLIAMGFPASNMEAAYRNSMSEVQKFLNKYHKGHYKVYNLCSERHYKETEFEKVAVYGFDDHNACPWKLLFDCCTDIQTFLKADEKNNVAVVHCKAGKGRTGLVLSAYLLFAGICKTAAEALEMFGRERTSNNKGVTIPSQMRYVRYMEFYLSKYKDKAQEFPIKGVPLKIVNFKLFPMADFDVGGGCDPYFILSDSAGKKFYNYKKKNKIAEWRKSGPHDIKCEIPIQGDVLISFYDHDAVSSDDKMFACWINTSFIRKSTIAFTKSELDKAVKDKKCAHFPKDFYVEITFSGVTEDDDDIPPPPPADTKEDSDTDDDEKDEVPPPPDLLDNDVPPPPPSDDVPPPPPPEEKEKKEKKDEKKAEKKDEKAPSSPKPNTSPSPSSPKLPATKAPSSPSSPPTKAPSSPSSPPKVLSSPKPTTMGEKDDKKDVKVVTQTKK